MCHTKKITCFYIGMLPYCRNGFEITVISLLFDWLTGYLETVFTNCTQVTAHISASPYCGVTHVLRYARGIVHLSETIFVFLLECIFVKSECHYVTHAARVLLLFGTSINKVEVEPFLVNCNGRYSRRCQSKLRLVLHQKLMLGVDC